MVRDANAHGLTKALHGAWDVVRRFQDEAVGARQVLAEYLENAIVHDRVARDFGHVAADEGEPLRPLHALDLVEPVQRFLVQHVAAEAVDGVRRITDDLTRFERVDRTADLAGLGPEGIDLEQHGFDVNSWVRAGVTTL